MPDIYHAADVFSIMSPYEGQSIVTLQAVATGLPVIGANAGALPELIHDNQNGFLVATYDYKDLAKRMNELAGSVSLRKKFGEESRKISLEHDKPKVLHKLEVIFDKLGRSTFPGRPERIS
jgi:glycosyltransferase involved in cell wall biosynthesis